MQLFDKPEPHRFGIKSLRGQEHDRKIRCARGIYVFFLYILRAFQKNFTQVFLRSGNILITDANDNKVYINATNGFQVRDKNNRIIAGNINQVLQVDSVVCNFDRYPYEARTYARQMIIRESNVTERTLVTACRLLNASRSDDNPNGFTIEGFTVLENKDIRTIER